MAETILVIEDTATYQQALKRALTRLGFQVTCAYSGEEGLEIIAKDIPHLIILDMLLPGISGKDVCRRLKLDYKFRLIPVMMLTMDERHSNLVEGLESGADAYVKKTEDLETIARRASSLVKLNKISAAIYDERYETHELKSKKLALVDDDVTYLHALKRHLEKSGFEIHLADSGAALFEFIYELSPDLVVVDYRMPVLEGSEVCRKLRKSEEFSDIPIIILSGNDDPKDIIRSFDAGANEYILKSESFDTVEAHINAILRRRQYESETRRISDKLTEAIKIKELLEVSEFQKKELEMMNQNLEQKARELSQASKYKSEFLANMSHELRTPLNSMLLLSRLLVKNGKGHLDDDEVRYAQMIHEGGYSLLELINDILDLSKVEAGMMAVNPGPVSISDLADDINHQFKPMASEKKLDFEVLVAKGTPECLHTDATRVKQVLRNLLGNALKFTTEGRVSLKISFKKDGKQKPYVAFSVEDTGIGISEERKKDIFEAFRQEDGSTSRIYGGTGLGLAISRQMSALLGGFVELKSEKGKGSTFTLAIPPGHLTSGQGPEVSQKEDIKASDKPEEWSFKEQEVLVVDDDTRNIFTLSTLLRTAKLRVHVAENGLKAISKLESMNSVDAILMDIMMPVMDGLEAIEKIRKMEKYQKTPIIALTAKAMPGDREELLQKGANFYVTKPVNEDELFGALHAAFSGSSKAEKYP